MNSGKRSPQILTPFQAKTGQRGNVMIYILLALALLAALTMVISSQNDQDNSDLSSDQAELAATKMVAYAGSVKTVVDQMLMSGTAFNSLDFTRPGDTGFDTAPYTNKVFHPSGGGLVLESADSNIFANPAPGSVVPKGWYLGKFNNFTWTPTTAQDVVLSAYLISQAVCSSINKKLTGSTTIPTIGGTGNLSDYFISAAITAGTNADFTASVCASCSGQPAMCVKNSNSTAGYVYYNIIEAQ